ncbi:putative RNase H [Serratia plymuthica 4Rx13]|nr:putative RNase H [Serratia plymuthica 4Rx13]
MSLPRRVNEPEVPTGVSKKERVLTVSTMIPTLEMQLHQPATRNNSKIVSELLHDDFEEIGRSGRHYDKRQTVAALEQETGRPVIHAEDFKLAMMTEGVALLTYKSFQRDAAGDITRLTLRLSVWVLSEHQTGERWQLRFHQGTPATESFFIKHSRPQ